MATYKYLISDLTIKISSEEEKLLNHFSDFCIYESGKNIENNLEVDVFANKIISIPPVDIIVNDSFK